MGDLRILTIRQPWADLIMAGVKDVENRRWPVPSTIVSARHGAPRLHEQPLTIGIHAAKAYDRAGNKAIIDWANSVNDETHARGSGLLLSPINQMLRFQDPERRGVLLGTIDVTDFHHAHDLRACAHRDPSDEYVPCSPWAEPDVWHWTLTDPQPLDQPIPAQGALGLWRPGPELAAQLQEAAHA